MTRRGHLRLLPKPLAKCEPPPAPYPPDSVNLRRAPVSGRWLIEKTAWGRTSTVNVTRDELIRLLADIGSELAESRGT